MDALEPAGWLNYENDRYNDSYVIYLLKNNTDSQIVRCFVPSAFILLIRKIALINTNAKNNTGFEIQPLVLAVVCISRGLALAFNLHTVTF